MPTAMVTAGSNRESGSLSGSVALVTAWNNQTIGRLALPFRIHAKNTNIATADPSAVGPMR